MADADCLGAPQKARCGLSVLGKTYPHVTIAACRDLKAANVLLQDGGTVLLTDFGAAAGGRHAGSHVGTPGFMRKHLISAELSSCCHMRQASCLIMTDPLVLCSARTAAWRHIRCLQG